MFVWEYDALYFMLLMLIKFRLDMRNKMLMSFLSLYWMVGRFNLIGMAVRGPPVYHQMDRQAPQRTAPLLLAQRLLAVIVIVQVNYYIREGQ